MKESNYAYIDVLTELMETNKLSQMRLAERIGVNQTTVGQWLRGKKKPTYDNILTICKCFDISPNEFFGM